MMTAQQPRLNVGQTWSPDSWRSQIALQQPSYKDVERLQQVTRVLATQPSLIEPQHLNVLKDVLVDASLGRRFILHAGDCAERFEDNTYEVVRQKYCLLRSFGDLLKASIGRPTAIIGRIAGQFAKPRTNDDECADGIMLPSYRGDLVNGYKPNHVARIHDPQRLLRGYQSAALIARLLHSLDEGKEPIYTSHEALVLDYEQSLTRQSSENGQWYNCSTHLPWLGVRTATTSPAHVEYLRGITNPIAIKVGPENNLQDLLCIIRQLNPTNLPGKIVLIHRFGLKRVMARLQPLLQTIATSQLKVTWFCDPMHGNTHQKDGCKYRLLSDIEEELSAAVAIHHVQGIPLGGVHLEVTHEDVLECLESADDISKQVMRSRVDPRLNSQQGQHVLMKFSQLYCSRTEDGKNVRHI